MNITVPGRRTVAVLSLGLGLLLGGCAGGGAGDTQAEVPAEIPAGKQPSPTSVRPEGPTYHRYGDRCAPNQLHLPGMTAEGKHLICTWDGSDMVWLTGPAPMGLGTASPGGPCENGMDGGQDEQGRLMICIEQQWVYG